MYRIHLLFIPSPYPKKVRGLPALLKVNKRRRTPGARAASITILPFKLLVSGKRHKRYVSRPLDSNGELSLMLGAAAGNASGEDLASLGYELPESVYIFIIDARSFISAERADLFAGSAGSGHHFAVAFIRVFPCIFFLSVRHNEVSFQLVVRCGQNGQPSSSLSAK